MRRTMRKRLTRPDRVDIVTRTMIVTRRIINVEAAKCKSQQSRKYIDEVVSLDLHAITKLRSDADCWFLYTGPHPKRRGARRKYDGKVNFQALGRFEDLGPRADEPHLHLYTAVVWHKTLQRRMRIVVLLNRKDPAKPRFIVLGSTDPELNGRKLVELYASRFQIEIV
jgi:hypothetical protein